MDRQEKYAVIYSSETGNTARLAKTIIEALGKENCCCFGSPRQEEEEIKAASVVFVGFWTDKGTCDETIQKFLSGLIGKKIVLFGTAGFGGSDEYFNQIIGRIKLNIDSSNIFLGSYMCQGKMQEAIKTRYEKMLEANPMDEKIKMLIANFDMAASHPDEEDKDKLVSWLSELKKKNLVQEK